MRPLHYKHHFIYILPNWHPVTCEFPNPIEWEIKVTLLLDLHWCFLHLACLTEVTCPGCFLTWKQESLSLSINSNRQGQRHWEFQKSKQQVCSCLHIWKGCPDSPICKSMTSLWQETRMPHPQWQCYPSSGVEGSSGCSSSCRVPTCGITRSDPHRKKLCVVPIVSYRKMRQGLGIFFFLSPKNKKEKR